MDEISLIKNQISNNNTNIPKSNNNNFGLTDETLSSAIYKFLLQVDIAHSSRITYKRGLSKFSEWCKSRYKDDRYTLKREDILEYKFFLDTLNLQPFTKSLYLVCLRQFFTWTESVLLYPNIAKGIKGSKKITKSHHKDSIQIESIKKLMESIDISYLYGLRDKLLISMLLHTGMRLIEVSGILMSDIEKSSSSKNYKIWIKGKGRDGKDAFVVLLPEISKSIDQYIKQREQETGRIVKQNDFLFVPHGTNGKDRSNKRMSTQSLSRIIRLRMEYAGIKHKRVSAHSLRHTFGVLAIQGGSSLYELQLAMRHSSPSTTQIYLGDIEKMKREEASPEHKVGAALKGII
jgi:integrase/recombinase XerD